MAMLRAGDLDRRVSVLRASQAGTDSYNAPELTWTTIRTVSASRQPVTGDESFDPVGEERFARSRVQFEMRWTDDLQTTDRLVCEGVTYDIRSIAEIGRREGVTVIGESQS